MHVAPRTISAMGSTSRRRSAAPLGFRCNCHAANGARLLSVHAHSLAGASSLSAAAFRGPVADVKAQPDCRRRSVPLRG